jgi:hypothetical protein
MENCGEVTVRTRQCSSTWISLEGKEGACCAEIAEAEAKATTMEVQSTVRGIEPTPKRR